MSFLLRATLVIGALSYLAATRGQPGPDSGAPGTAARPAAMDEAAPAASKGSTPLPTLGAIAATWNALPADARQRLAQEAVAELGQRVGPTTASRDTLAETDRRAAWRGAGGR